MVISQEMEINLPISFKHLDNAAQQKNTLLLKQIEQSGYFVS